MAGARGRARRRAFRIAAFTGLRLGELLALRWEDVNIDARRLVVQRAVSAGIEGPTKSWQARFIPLADPVADALQRLVTRGHYTQRDDYVFCSRLGRRLDGSAVRRRFKRARDAAGLRPLRFHALRHAAGSLVARHADARFVQGFLGHSRITTTERYMHAKARPEDRGACEPSVPNRRRNSPEAERSSDRDAREPSPGSGWSHEPNQREDRANGKIERLTAEAVAALMTPAQAKTPEERREAMRRAPRGSARTSASRPPITVRR